jgi:hypothetical protein
MSIGYDQQQKTYTNDTIVLDAYLYERDGETLVSLVDINSVVFTVRTPTDTTVPSLNAVAGTIVPDEDGHAQYLVSQAINLVAGEYKAIAQFSLVDGRKQTVVCDYDVIDPFQTTGTDDVSILLEDTWHRIEDCFDSEMGNAGPWLRDMTLAKFDQTKLLKLLPDAMVEINTWQPYTSFTATSFPYTDPNGQAVLVQGLLCATIRHLMRSYTEQPDVTNSNIGFLDRKRYADEWGKRLQVEDDRFKKLLIMWKRTMFGFGRPATLIGTKAGRILNAPMRSRMSGRGYYG